MKAVRGRRHFPIKPDCGAAAEQRAGGGKGTAGLGGTSPRQTQDEEEGECLFPSSPAPIMALLPG